MKEERLWERELSCGHKRLTSIAFMVEDYKKPTGKTCYCRECNKMVEVIGVEECSKKEIEELKKTIKEWNFMHDLKWQ